MQVNALPVLKPLPEPVRRFVDGLTREQRLLLVLKRELYDGRWEPMIADLRNRLGGRPYVIRLASRIADDLERIRCMMDVEERHGVSLSGYVDGMGETERFA